jgi:hypothetical protein
MQMADSDIKKQEFEAIVRLWCEGDLYNEQNSMDYNTLPKTIHDCIRVAKSLDWMRYKAYNKFISLYDTYHPSDDVEQDKILITSLFKTEW